MTLMSKIGEILSEKCLKTVDNQKIVCNKGTDPLRITIGSHGIIQGPFFGHFLKAECLRSILSFYRLQNAYKSSKLCLFENLCTLVAAVFLGELTLQWAVWWHQILLYNHTRWCSYILQTWYWYNNNQTLLGFE